MVILESSSRVNKSVLRMNFPSSYLVPGQNTNHQTLPLSTKTLSPMLWTADPGASASSSTSSSVSSMDTNAVMVAASVPVGPLICWW